jgi:hypothetical protein
MTSKLTLQGQQALKLMIGVLCAFTVGLVHTLHTLPEAASLISHSGGLPLSLPWLWRKYAPLKRQSTSTTLHGAIKFKFLNTGFMLHKYCIYCECQLNTLMLPWNAKFRGPQIFVLAVAGRIPKCCGTHPSFQKGPVLARNKSWVSSTHWCPW